MTQQTHNQQISDLDMTPIARVIGFLIMHIAHVECAAGYQYGQDRPAALKGEPDVLDAILADERPLVAFNGSGASDTLFVKDVIAANEAYKTLMRVSGKALKVPGGGDVEDVEVEDSTDSNLWNLREFADDAPIALPHTVIGETGETMIPVAGDTVNDPEFSDGCDCDGFKGGCERNGHSATECPTAEALTNANKDSSV